MILKGYNLPLLPSESNFLVVLAWFFPSLRVNQSLPDAPVSRFIPLCPGGWGRPTPRQLCILLNLLFMLLQPMSEWERSAAQVVGKGEKDDSCGKGERSGQEGKKHDSPRSWEEVKIIVSHLPFVHTMFLVKATGTNGCCSFC